MGWVHRRMHPCMHARAHASTHAHTHTHTHAQMYIWTFINLRIYMKYCMCQVLDKTTYTKTHTRTISMTSSDNGSFCRIVRARHHGYLYITGFLDSHLFLPPGNLGQSLWSTERERERDKHIPRWESENISQGILDVQSYIFLFFGKLKNRNNIIFKDNPTVAI